MSHLAIDLGPSRTGLIVTATLILNGALAGSVSLTENPTGYYSGSMPSVAAGVYGVRFLSAGALVGTGTIVWDGAAERTALNLATATALAAIPTNPLLTTDSRLNTLDAAISSRSTYDGSDTPGTVTLVSRLTSIRANYLDKLNVSGILAHSDDAATYRADVSGLLTSAAYIPPPTPSDIWAHTTRTLTTAGLSASDIWSYAGRTLDGTQAAHIASIASIPTNPLLTTDARIQHLDVPVSSRLAAISYTEPLTILQTANAVDDALTAYGAATLASIEPIPTNPLLADDGRIDALLALAQADEVISPTQYRKLAAGTETAILTKAVTNDGAGNIDLREAP